MQWRPKSTTAAQPASRPAPETPPEPPPANGTAQRQRRKQRGKKAKPAKLSHMKKPDGMTLEQWQIELRRQFGREQKFVLKNLDGDRLFSEYQVTNPQTRSTYRVHIRGVEPGENYCTCPDFATNTLGTCKHIEFTLARLERTRGGKKALRNGYQPPYSEVYLHYGARREVRFRPGRRCPVEFARLAAGYFGEDGALLPDAVARFEEFLGGAEKLDHELRCHQDVVTFLAGLRDAEQRRQRVAEAFPRGIRSAAFKDLLSVPLYDYQREGVLFAAQAGRCLIGDEMGLGKTAQAVATVEVMARLLGVERVLVVCPTSLKHQWQREVERFVKRTVHVVGGLRGRRERDFAVDSFYKVMNYDTVHRDLDLITGWAPDLVILDEAQRIKNWATRTARSVKKIVSPYALVLTGTPLENRLEELISIVQFVDNHRLGPTFRLLHEHQQRDEFGKVTGYRNLDQIGETLRPILVRRQKDTVLDQLPERIDSNVFVPMTELQRKHHDENREIVAKIVNKWKQYGFLTETDRQRLMIALQRMRMACDSAYLVDHVNDNGVKADEALTLLDELLEQPDVKVVVFSQWKRMHELLVRRFQKKGWEYVLFHGSVPAGKRRDLVDRFREDPKCRVFLATDAGGTGLNLQHASVVINMDQPWNPAVLEQRIGRVHRLGQGRPVRVVNFVAQGTIEEGMLSVLKFKRDLFAGVLDGGDKDVFLGGSKLKRFMETVEAATSAIPEGMIEDAEGALIDRSEAAAAEEVQPTRGRRRGRRPAAPTAVTAATAAAMGETDGEAEEVQAPAAAAQADPWSGLLQVGMALLQQFAGGAAGPTAGSTATPRPAAVAARVERDARTGETYLKVPVPKPEVLEQALKAFGALLESMRP